MGSCFPPVRCLVLVINFYSFFLGGSGGGGGHGFLPTIVGLCYEGGPEKKTHQIIGGASKNLKGENLKSS